MPKQPKFSEKNKTTMIKRARTVMTGEHLLVCILVCKELLAIYKSST